MRTCPFDTVRLVVSWAGYVTGCRYERISSPRLCESVPQKLLYSAFSKCQKTDERADIMAKTAKLKHDASRSPRSRAAKRAASPSIDTDKSLKDIDRTDIGPVLHSRHNAGVVKKKKSKPLKRGQRARMEKGLSRAEAVMDQMEKKVEGSQARSKRRRDRRALWEEVNDDAKEEQRKAPKFDVLQSVEDGGDDEWVDENDDQAVAGDDTEMKIVEGVKVPANAAAIQMVVVERPASTSVAPEALDEIT
jgi:hypothetical protein